MTLTPLLPLLLAFTFAAPAVAQDKSYADARHLYEKALLAIEDLDERLHDRQYASLSWELAEYGDRELLARIPPKVSEPLLRAMVLSNLAEAHARAGDCPAALDVTDSLLNNEVAKTLEDDPRDFHAQAAFKNAVETYAYCGMLEQAEAAIASYQPGKKERKVYLAQAYSFVATALYRADRSADGARYFAKALSLAEALDGGESRNEALGHIAEEQILAGRFDDAFKSLAAIDLDAEPDPVDRASLRDGRFSMLAYALAREGRWEEVAVALGYLSDEGSRYPHWLVLLRLDQIETLDTDRALAQLAELLSRLEQAGDDHSLTYDASLAYIARAFAARGEEKRALAILDDLYEQNVAKYRRYRRGSGESFTAISRLNAVLSTYVWIGRPQAALDKLSSGPFDSSRLDEMGGAWGYLAGHARLNGDERLLAQLELTSNERKDDVFELRATVGYLAEKGAYAEAEQLLDGIPASDGMRFYVRNRFYSVPHLYTELAWYMMGVTYWDLVYGRSDYSF